MASKSAQASQEKVEVIEELLELLDKTLDRVKVLYEQFFLGMQKQPPTHMHTDVERKLRDLTQMQIRNTALRYRFATLQQKFGSYNSYWRRTLRQIENGTYHRNLAKIGRQAALTGEEIPEEILAAMPKRMREQVKRDREIALARLRKRGDADADVQDADGLDGLEISEEAPVIRRAKSKSQRGADGAFHLDDGDSDFDLDAYFRGITNDDSPSNDSPSEDTNPELHIFADTPPRGARPAPFSEPFTDETATPPRGFRTEMSGRFPAAREPTRREPEAEPVPAAREPTRREPEAEPVPDPPPRPQPNAAVRAAVGMRTPVAGMPVAPHGMPAQRAQDPSPPDAAVVPAPAVERRTGPHVIPRAPQAPSQVVRPLPVMPGASANRAPVQVESMSGPFPREQGAPKNPAMRTAQGIQPHPRTPAMPSIPAPNKSGPVPAPSIPASNVPAPNAVTTAIPVPNIPRQPPSGPSRPGTPAPRAGTPPLQPAPSPAPQRTQPIAAAPRTQPAKVRATTEPGVAAPARQGPPPGMTDADVNALYAKYVKAKEAVGEKAGPGAYGKLLRTINQQAPKIMEQYNAKGVDFQVVVKDNQVVIRAKPKP